METRTRLEFDRNGQMVRVTLVRAVSPSPSIPPAGIHYPLMPPLEPGFRRKAVYVGKNPDFTIVAVKAVDVQMAPACP